MVGMITSQVGKFSLFELKMSTISKRRSFVAFERRNFFSREGVNVYTMLRKSVALCSPKVKHCFEVFCEVLKLAFLLYRQNTPETLNLAGVFTLRKFQRKFTVNNLIQNTTVLCTLYNVSCPQYSVLNTSPSFRTLNKG